MARSLNDVWRIVLQLVELFSVAIAVPKRFVGVICLKITTGTVCDDSVNGLEFYSRTPQDMADVNYWARPSVAFIRCNTCRDTTIVKPVVQPGSRLLLFCAGTLRVPPNYWAERTAKHVEAIKAGFPPPNFRAKIGPEEKKKLATERKVISDAKRAVEKKQRAQVKDKKQREEAARLNPGMLGPFATRGVTRPPMIPNAAMPSYTQALMNPQGSGVRLAMEITAADREFKRPVAGMPQGPGTGVNQGGYRPGQGAGSVPGQGRGLNPMLGREGGALPALERGMMAMSGRGKDF